MNLPDLNPSGLSPRSWLSVTWLKLHPKTRSVLEETWRLIVSKDLGTKAGALTSALSLSFVPLLAIAFTFFKLFGGLQEFLDDTLEPLIIEHFSEDAGEQIVGYLNSFVENMNVNAMSAVSFVTLLGTTISLLFTIESAFNDIYGVRTPRTLLQRVVNYWVMLTVTPLVIVFSSSKFGSIFSAFDFAKGFLEQHGMIHILHWCLGFLSQTLGFSLLFFLLPHRKLPWKAVCAAGLLTSISFDALQYVNIYLTKRAFADTTIKALYGSVALIPVIFFYWVKLIFYILLAGACLSIAIARQMGTRNESNGVVPAQTIFVAAQLLKQCAEAFHRGLPGPDTKELLGLAAVQTGPEHLNPALIWLRRAGFLNGLIRASDGEFCYVITAKGLHMSRNPRAFLWECFGAANIGSPPTPPATGTGTPCAHLDDDLLNRIERVLQQGPNPQT